MLHELHSNLAHKASLPPLAAAITDNTAQGGAIVDMQGHAAVEFYIITGTLADADATFAVTLTAGDVVDNPSAPTTITDSAPAAAECVLGNANFTFADDGVV